MARQLEEEHTGVPIRGPRSFGRNDDGTVNEAEAKVLRELWPKILHGDSVYQWIERLNQRGVPTSRGNTWTSPGLIYLLRNPRLAGVRLLAGELVPVEGLEPIVSVDEHQQMCAVLDDRASDRKPRTDNPSVRKYLLTGGICKCGNCGKPLHAKRSQSGTRGMSCLKPAPHNGCGKIRIAAQPLEDAVAVEVLGRISQPHILEQLHAAVATSEATGRALAESIGDVQAELRRLAGMYMRKEIGKTAFRAAEAEGESQLRQLRAEVKRVQLTTRVPVIAGPDDLARWWNEESSVQERHDLVATLIDEIRILPSKRPGFRGYDPERVVYVWRFA